MLQDSLSGLIRARSVPFMCPSGCLWTPSGPKAPECPKKVRTRVFPGLLFGTPSCTLWRHFSFDADHKGTGSLYRKIPGTPAGCPWKSTRYWDKLGVDRPVSPSYFAVICYTEKAAFFAGTPGVPGTLGHPGGFQKFCVIFSYLPLSAP